MSKERDLFAEFNISTEQKYIIVNTLIMAWIDSRNAFNQNLPMSYLEYEVKERFPIVEGICHGFEDILTEMNESVTFTTAGGAPSVVVFKDKNVECYLYAFTLIKRLVNSTIGGDFGKIEMFGINSQLKLLNILSAFEIFNISKSSKEYTLAPFNIDLLAEVLQNVSASSWDDELVTKEMIVTNHTMKSLLPSRKYSQRLYDEYKNGLVLTDKAFL